MSTQALRPKKKPKRKIHKPHPPTRRWNGYRSWAQHVAEFNRYIRDDLDYHLSFFVDVWAACQHRTPQISELTEDDVKTLRDPKQPFGGPPRPSHPKKPAVSAQEQIRRPAPEAPRHLYVLEVDDLLGFTEEDVLDSWAFRTQCCGSKEAASELYALFRVLNGDDQYYAGATAYLEHPEVLAVFTIPQSEELAIQAIDTATESAMGLAPVPERQAEDERETIIGLSLADVRKLTAGPLKAAWDNRPESFASLEAAAETLSILRSLKSAEPTKPNFRTMMEHDLVQDLLDVLPLELAPVAPCPNVELNLLHTDQRTVRAQAAVVRPRQGNFRSSLFQRYGGACCITGCQIDTLLEAAHIIPYRGDQSDDVSNGLLLRVDLHRLFDAHLITMNPHTVAVEVCSTIEDAVYRAYHGKRLFKFSPKPRMLFLETHYATFKRVATPAK